MQLTGGYKRWWTACRQPPRHLARQIIFHELRGGPATVPVAHTVQRPFAHVVCVLGQLLKVFIDDDDVLVAPECVLQHCHKRKWKKKTKKRPGGVEVQVERRLWTSACRLPVQGTRNSVGNTDSPASCSGCRESQRKATCDR